MNASTPADTLADLAARYWRFLCHELPMTAVMAGEATSDAVLYRESPADYDRRYRVAGEMLAELNGIASSALTAQDRATYQLLRYELENTRRLHEVAAHHRPVLFPAGPAYSTAYFANSATVTDGGSAERYVDRLATLPAYLDDLQDALRAGQAMGMRYPRLVLECTVGSLRALTGPVDAQPWLKPLERSVAADKEAIRRQTDRARACVASELTPAIDAFSRFLEGPLADGARDTVACSDAPQGREFYRALVRHFTTTALSPDEVHELGRSEVERLEGEIAAVAAEAGYAGDLAAYRHFLSSDTFILPSKEALREQIEILSKRIDARIPAFFGRIPRITYGVDTIPEAVAVRMPPAYAQPNPADRSAPGIHWITSLQNRCPSYLHVSLALHEAWPGHLMHIALIQEADGLPAFRRHGALRYLACLEGWAVYCESLGVDMGLYQTPHQRYGRLESETWRAVRLVVDTGIHWRGWSRQRAIDYMASHLALPLATIQGEVDRYIGWPGQALVYQIGNLHLRAIRQRAEQQLGSRFDQRAFHDAVTAAGAVTLPVLTDLMDDWLTRQSSRGPREEAASVRG